VTGRRPTLAVVGATGAVGTVLLRLLSMREDVWGEIRLVASSRSAGRKLQVRGEQVPVVALTERALEGVDVAVFDVPPGVSEAWAPIATAKGAVVVDNSGAFRGEPGVPLVVPEVNPADAATHEGIIANPNCSTMQLVPLLMALRDSVGLERVIVDTYQSVSGTGAEAVAELEAQISAHASGDAPQASVYPHPIAFNALPEIDVFRDDGYSKEEWKVIAESRKILHLPDLRVSCTAVRVPVFFAHSEAVHVETSRPITPDQARAAFAAVPGVIVRDDPAGHAYPLATEAAGSDDIFVGRIRQDVSVGGGRGLAFWVVSDNLRKGAATNAIQIAELALREGWLAPASQRTSATAAQPAAAATTGHAA
jgi:aspartate-semialdehyde dehydrogenase